MRLAVYLMITFIVPAYADGRRPGPDTAGVEHDTYREQRVQRELDRLRAQADRLERQAAQLDRARRRDPPDPASERLYQAYRHQLGKTRSELESRRHQAYVDRVLRGLSK